MANQVTPQPFQPGFRLFDGTDMNNALARVQPSSQAGVIGGAVAQATATLLTAGVNSIAVAGAGVAVKLPQGAAGLMVVVANNSGQTVSVYPFGANDVIDALAAAAARTIANTHSGIFFCTSVVGGVANWISIGGAVVS